ncbi:uncharacterized protein LOC122062063 isoform X2 [Macadamia integrifolia]|uniref:uncharacterized protein LOC122062063 isoform X2 n=1 Tax=Macadamia integrifolia TaxID=60698 RepID=UPI001C5314C9|nr:uncharacterized protein LOC122062063 isoform X2 [Macadamia integrifolia]
MDNQRALRTQSSRTKSIRAGMCVLVVDDDIKNLNIVAVMLRALQYEVVPVKRMSDALDILQERHGRFDIVLTVLHMPKMDGISLLEHVEAEFKIPVIMMSANDDEIVASICLDSGASFYLTKPLTISDLSNLWQYVYLKKRYERMAIEQIGSDSELSTPKKVSKGDNDECASSVNESSWRQESRKKHSLRKNQNNEGNNEDNMSRVTWTTKLHNKFLDAIDQIGLQVPMKILEAMNTPGLTREKVASHLQKYRKFLRRIKQASQSGEPSVIKSVKHAAFKSKIASGHPSLERVFSCISKQKKCSISQLGDENSLPERNQEKLKQRLLDNISSINQQHDGTSSPSQMETPNTREGSSLCGSTPTTLASNTDTLPIIHPELQARTGHFARGALDHSLNKTSLPSKNIQNVRNTRSFNNLNQGPSFSYSNNGFAGIQMNSSTAKVSGFNQMNIGHEPANGTNCGYSSRDEIQNGKRPLVDTEKSPFIPGFTSSHFDFASQGLTSSSGLMPQGLAPTGELVPHGSISSSVFNQVHIGHELANGTSFGYSRRDEIQNGKGPLVDTEKSPLIPVFTSSHSDYASQGITSSSGLMTQGLAPNGGLVPQGSISSSGFNQMHVGHEVANGSNCGYNRRDEIQNGKRPLLDTEKSPLIPGFTSSHSDYASQGLTSSSGLMPQGLAPTGGLVPQGSISSSGFNQMHIGYEPTNGTNFGYSRREQIRNGKRPLVETEISPFIPRFTSFHSDYASQGLTSSNGRMPQGLAPSGGLVPQGSISSNGFSSTNPFSPILTNVSQQLPLLSPLAHPPPSSQQQKNEIGVGEEVNSLFDLMKNNSSLGNFSFAPSFDVEYDLSDILFKPVDQSPNQHEVCGEVVMDPKFSINDYYVDDDYTSLWLPP